MEATTVRERQTVALRKGPLFDIRGSVQAMWECAQATVHRNCERAPALLFEGDVVDDHNSFFRTVEAEADFANLR